MRRRLSYRRSIVHAVGSRISAVTTDCKDARGLAEFWAAVLGGAVRDSGNGYFAVDGASSQVAMVFQPVADPRPAKNSMHLDLSADDIGAELVRLRSLGATVVAERSDSNFHWWVLADPEGNLFCLG